MTFNELLKNEFIFLDGAMGTMLQNAGLAAGEIPELLSLTSPDEITAIHKAYIEAGANIVYTNTFGANRSKLERCGYSVDEVVCAAVKNARAAAGDDALSVLISVP